MVNLILDGQSIEVEEGWTILEAAQYYGVDDIPTLCHMDGLSEYSACRVCVVEVIQGERSRLVASCSYLVHEGIEGKDQVGEGAEGEEHDNRTDACIVSQLQDPPVHGIQVRRDKYKVQGGGQGMPAVWPLCPHLRRADAEWCHRVLQPRD